MARTKFTVRLADAIRTLRGDSSIGAVECRSGSLFSPVFRKGKYSWLKVMDSDGLLVARRRVHNGEGASPRDAISLVVGVVVQSEDATAQTKPNPLGKAALSHLPYGVWVDTADTGRTRLDRVMILFVLPKGAAAARQARFATAKRNVLNASDIMPDAVSIEVTRGAGANAIAEAIKKEARPFLVGRGRPRGAA